MGIFDRPGDHGAVLKAIDVALAAINTKLEKMMTALADLQAEDTALQATVAQVLTDFAAALAAAGSDPAAIEQVVTDMQAMAATLTAADPATPVPPVPPATA